jgi:signal transduction histidine kinase
MRIELVSEDGDLYRMCRDILTEVAGLRCNLTAVSAENATPDADLYIWDFQPDQVRADQMQRAAAHLFLVNRCDLADFRVEMGSSAPLILLKPVTRAALTAFLTLAVSSEAANWLLEDRDEILQCLIQTNLKLQEYDQDRTNFLARAVHDFRAPLTALSGYCGLLLSGPLGGLNEKQREVLGRMQHSVHRLSRLAETMYQLSVGQRLKRRPAVEKGEIRVCLEQALHEIGPFAEGKQITISVNLKPSSSLYFDAGQLEQVFINVLHNACKFTPKFGSIEVRGYPYFWERRSSSASFPAQSERRHRKTGETNSYRIDVQDSGRPIPEDRIQRIFEEYVSYAGSSDRSGGGLGLAICRMIISQHNGCIWAENTDRGPMFSFTLPFWRSDAEEELLKVEAMQGVSA